MVKAIERKLIESKLLQTVVILIAIASSAVAVSVRIGKVEGRVSVCEAKIETNKTMSERILRLENRPVNILPAWFENSFAEFKTEIKTSINNMSSEIKCLSIELVKLQTANCLKPKTELNVK